MSIDRALQGNRPGTSRPATTLGRQVRLGTASMQSDSGVFIDVDRLDLKRYATRPAIAKVCAFVHSCHAIDSMVDSMVGMCR